MNNNSKQRHSHRLIRSTNSTAGQCMSCLYTLIRGILDRVEGSTDPSNIPLNIGRVSGVACVALAALYIIMEILILGRIFGKQTVVPWDVYCPKIYIPRDYCALSPVQYFFLIDRPTSADIAHNIRATLQQPGLPHHQITSSSFHNKPT